MDENPVSNTLVARLRLAVGAIWHTIDLLDEEMPTTNQDDFVLRKELFQLVGKLIRLEDATRGRLGVPESGYSQGLDPETYSWSLRFVSTLRESHDCASRGSVSDARRVWEEFLAQSPPAFVQKAASRELTRVLTLTDE